jgi:dTDP-4-amino-4,6-dideoxygalactose transaminase
MKVPFLDVGATYEELHEELDAAYRRVMESGWFVLGPELEAFEREFADYCGVRHCIGVGNGLEALALILEANEIGPGDEVLVPANTYVATWLAVSRVGANPVPVEPRDATYNIDPKLVEKAISARTRAVIVVHLYGQPAECGPISDLAAKRGIALVEDVAQAHGARYMGRRCGSLGDAAGFSFYPSKNLGAYGDAGAVTTNDAETASKVRLLRNYGSGHKNTNAMRGANSRLDEMQAAFLRVRLRHLDDWNSRRAANAGHYLDQLAERAPQLSLPEVPETVEPVWHQFVIRHADRDRLARELSRSGVETMIHYPVAPHQSPAYRDPTTGSPPLPRTERLASEVLSIPIGPHLSSDQVATVTEALTDAADQGSSAHAQTR